MHLATVQCHLHVGSDGETVIWSNGIFEGRVSLFENEKRFFFFTAIFQEIGGIFWPS